MNSCALFKSIILLLTFISITNFSVADEPQIVGITPLSSILISTKNSSPANVISLNNSTISAEISGRALNIYAEVGEVVKKDQKLVSLDCRSYTLAKKQAEAALKVAMAQLDLAKKELIRSQRLIKKGTIPRELFDKTEANQQIAMADIEVKKAAIETSDLAIDRCTIRAPFAGQITQRMIQNGQLVVAGTPLFQLMQSDKMEISSKLSPADITKLADTSKLEFVAGDIRFKAQLRSVIQTIDQSSRTQEVRLSLPATETLAAGLSGRIEWNDKSKKLPTEYIQRRNASLGVMIAEDLVEGTGKARFIPLKNAIEGQPAEIELPANTAIINKNQFRVVDGQAIQFQK
jgi:RND family efflux transporter MFP subunit